MNNALIIEDYAVHLAQEAEGGVEVGRARTHHYQQHPHHVDTWLVLGHTRKLLELKTHRVLMSKNYFHIWFTSYKVLKKHQKIQRRHYVYDL